MPVETPTEKLILKYSGTIPQPKMAISAPIVTLLSWGFFQVTKQKKKKKVIVRAVMQRCVSVNRADTFRLQTLSETNKTSCRII